MPVGRSCLLVAWSNAFFAGQVSLDEVVDTVTGADAAHRLVGMHGPSTAPLRELVTTWRRTGEPAHVVLPVPGDVRGVPGPRHFSASALEAGEGAYCADLGVTPVIESYAPSSAPPTVTWQACVVEPAPPDELSLTDVNYELSTAIRECASALSAARVSDTPVAPSANLATGLSDARSAGERLRLPRGHPPRAVSLLAQAERLQLVVELALADATADGAGAVRSQALRPLTAAVRRARIAGYNAFD